MSDNPFEVLKLPPSESPEVIVRQGARLMQRTADESARNAVRQAVRALTESDEARVVQALLTHPNPGYGSVELERLTAAFRRPPRAAGEAICPALDQDEFRELLLSVIAAEVTPPPLPLECVTSSEPPEEIERQTAEALWQSLVAQPRG
jgi:hypothetical protein